VVAVVYLDNPQLLVDLAAALKELEAPQAVEQEPLTKGLPVEIGLQVDLLAQVAAAQVLQVRPNQPQMLVQAAMVYLHQLLALLLQGLVAAAVDHKAHMVVEVQPLVERVVEEMVLVHRRQEQPEPQTRGQVAAVVDTQDLPVQVATVDLVLFLFRFHLPVLQHSPLE
jgi:hypothetical protein